jgi:hypothetical protein
MPHTLAGRAEVVVVPGVGTHYEGAIVAQVSLDRHRLHQTLIVTIEPTAKLPSYVQDISSGSYLVTVQLQAIGKQLRPIRITAIQRLDSLSGAGALVGRSEGTKVAKIIRLAQRREEDQSIREIYDEVDYEPILSAA